MDRTSSREIRRLLAVRGPFASLREACFRKGRSSRFAQDAKIRKDAKEHPNPAQEISNLPFYYRGAVIAEQPVKSSPKRAS
jgi:hypothetical protein